MEFSGSRYNRADEEHVAEAVLVTFIQVAITKQGSSILLVASLFRLDGHQHHSGEEEETRGQGTAAVLVVRVKGHHQLIARRVFFLILNATGGGTKTYIRNEIDGGIHIQVGLYNKDAKGIPT